MKRLIKNLILLLLSTSSLTLSANENEHNGLLNRFLTDEIKGILDASHGHNDPGTIRAYLRPVDDQSMLRILVFDGTYGSAGYANGIKELNKHYDSYQEFMKSSCYNFEIMSKRYNLHIKNIYLIFTTSDYTYRKEASYYKDECT